MTHIPKSAASPNPKAGGDFAEEIVGHWQLYYKTTQNVSLEAIEDLKSQIRKRCVPKSSVASDNRLLALAEKLEQTIHDPDKKWRDIAVNQVIEELKSLASDKSELRKRISDILKDCDLIETDLRLAPKDGHVTRALSDLRDIKRRLSILEAEEK